ncbi:MAG: PorT family protein [Saprospiraceae bacterium]|nr:PorT family protein [Saprospiraceae bacterium]
MKRIWVLILMLFFVGLKIYAQEFHFGIRGGVNFSTISGPLESEVLESYKINNGFHFGVEGLYSFNDYFSAGAEIQYSQIGAKYKYQGPSYYIFFDDDSYLLRNDNVTYDINLSNSYIYVPLNLHIKPVKKLEFKLGGYFGFLINPSGNGTMQFGNKFNQKLKYNYYSDKDAPNPYVNYGILYIKTTNADGKEEIRTTKQTSRAYNQFPVADYKDGSFYKVFDAGLNFGINYFINTSLLVGMNFQYGLTDITNNKLDRSLKSLSDDGDLFFNNEDKLIYKDDFDRNMNLQVSLGFRF